VKRPAWEEARALEDELARMMAANGSTRGDAVRRVVIGAYRKALLGNPAISPELLLVDITETGNGIRVVVHDGAHVPGAMTQRFTRRYHVVPWLALGANFS
jgi:hypothetical protein